MVVPVMKRILSKWQARSTKGRETEANRCKISHLRSSHRSNTKSKEKPITLGYTASTGLSICYKPHKQLGKEVWKTSGKGIKKPVEL